MKLNHVAITRLAKRLRSLAGQYLTLGMSDDEVRAWATETCVVAGTIESHAQTSSEAGPLRVHSVGGHSIGVSRREGDRFTWVASLTMDEAEELMGAISMLTNTSRARQRRASERQTEVRNSPSTKPSRTTARGASSQSDAPQHGQDLTTRDVSNVEAQDPHTIATTSMGEE